METNALPAGKSRMSRFSPRNYDGIDVFNFAGNVIMGLEE